MSDPAVEAAQRAFHDGNHFTQDAAREALRPIRELHKPYVTATSDAVVRCSGCSRPWPCDTAKLIYTTEELER